jgi:hypothetical protein
MWWTQYAHLKMAVWCHAPSRLLFLHQSQSNWWRLQRFCRLWQLHSKSCDSSPTCHGQQSWESSERWADSLAFSFSTAPLKPACPPQLVPLQ